MMSHSARQGERDTLQQFIDDSMNDLMNDADTKKMDFICDLVWLGKVKVDDLIEYCNKEAEDYYKVQFRPR